MARDGNLFTGGGVTAGIDFALTVAAELAGAAFAQGLQLILEYAPAPPFDAGRPETAPPEVLAAVKRGWQAFLPKRVAEAMRLPRPWPPAGPRASGIDQRRHVVARHVVQRQSVAPYDSQREQIDAVEAAGVQREVVPSRCGRWRRRRSGRSDAPRATARQT